MFKLFKTLKKSDWGLMLASVVLIVAQVWLDLKMPDYMSKITRLVQTEGSAMSEILSAGGMMLLCALGSLVSAACVSILAGRIATNFGAGLRGRLFNKVQSFSMEEIGRFSTASLITRSTNDVTQVQMVIIMGLQVMIKAPITAGMAIGKISGKAWQWTMATAIAIGILLVLITIAVIWFFMPHYGVPAFLGGWFLSLLCNAGLSLGRLYQRTGVFPSLYNCFLKPFQYVQ